MKRHITPLTLACTLTLTLSGCSNEPELTVPKTLCHVPIKQDLLAPLLPAHGKLKEKRDSYGANRGIEGCSLTVDGKYELSVTGEWHTRGYPLRKTNLPPPKITSDGKFGYWYEGASTVLQCHAPNETVNGVHPEDAAAETYTLVVEKTKATQTTPAERTALKKLIRPYSKEYRKKLPCSDA